MSHPYTVLYNGGDPIAGDIHLYTYLYPNGSAEDDESQNEMASALAGALGDLRSFGAIDYWEVNISYHHPNLPDPDASTFETEFEDFIRVDTGYHQYKGVHIGVSEEYDFANGEYVEENCQTAFDRDTIATVGTAGLQGRYTNFAVQEPLHNAIRYDLIDDETDLIQSGSHMHEHDLGEITALYYLTPMATLYWDTHAQHGRCTEKTSWYGDYTNTNYYVYERGCANHSES